MAITINCNRCSHFYTYAYDVAGRLISTTTPLDYQVEMTYDKVDNLIKETDSLGRVTTYEYDLLHNMTKSVDAEGGFSNIGDKLF